MSAGGSGGAAYCERCGSALEAGARFCGSCGAPASPGAVPTPPPGDGPPPPAGPLWAQPGPPSPASDDVRRDRTLRGIALGLAIVVAGLVAAVAVLVWRSGGQDEVVVVLEPAGSVRSDGFTDSVVTATPSGIARPVALDGSSSAQARLASSQGGSAGLYAVGADVPCDVERLVDLLVADDATARTWAGVVGIDVADIEPTVTSYTPVLLARDTAVTNHLYRSGEAEPYQSVLQRGTPVLVDAYGVPRVQCSCGNPLDRPELGGGTVVLEGESWEDFDLEDLVEIEPADEEQAGLVVEDLDSGEEVEVPVGPGPAPLDGFLVANDDGVSVLGDDGSTTSVIDEGVEVAFDDLEGGVVFSYAYATDEYRPSTPREGSIYWLPAGATEPEVLLDAPNPMDQWFRLLEVGEFGGRRLVLYEEITYEHVVPERSMDDWQGRLLARDLDSGETREIEPHSSGWEEPLGDVSTIDGHLTYGLYDLLAGQIIVTGPELTEPIATWNPWGEFGEECEDPALLVSCPLAQAIDRDGRLVTVVADDGYEVIEKLQVVDPVGPSLVDEVAVGIPNEGSYVIDVRDRRALLSALLRDGDRTPAVLVDFDSDEVETLPVTGVVRFLNAPLRLAPVDAPAASGDPTPPSDVDPADTTDEVGDTTTSCGEAHGGDVDRLALMVVEAINAQDYPPLEGCVAGDEVIEQMRDLEWAAPLVVDGPCTMEVEVECWVVGGGGGWFAVVHINSGSAGELITSVESVGGGL